MFDMNKKKIDVDADKESPENAEVFTELPVPDPENAETVIEKLEEGTDSHKEEPGKSGLMYVGPTIPDLAIQNRVYTDIPQGALNKIEKEPELRNLFIKITDYPKANRMLREKDGYIFRAFEKALKLRK